MGKQTNTGGPAFPFTERNNDGTYYHGTPGMTLRDHFAGLALVALINKEDKEPDKLGKKGVPILAKYAYEYADEMIKARGGA